MKLLKELHQHNPDINYKVRKAGRAVLFAEDKVALLYVGKKNYHKLPGGGVKPEEDIKQGLARELMEETGCEAKVNGEIGMTIEYRDEFEQIQFSYCYLAKVTKDCQTLSFTDKEKADGFELKWVSLDEAIKLLELDQPDNYAGKFIVARDLTFLKEVKNII